MPRIRTIKPQFWFDENLGTISRDARLLYIGLWNLSDDRGVFEYRPSRIKVQLFPYDTDLKVNQVADWLQQLQTTGDVIYFEEKGKTFGYIPTFSKHQEIRKPSKWHFTEVVPESTPPVTHQLSTSSTREKEKEKEKLEGSKNAPYVPPTENNNGKKPFGELENVMLTLEEKNKIVQRFGDQGATDWIEELSLAKASKGYKTKSDYATILAWERRRKIDSIQKKEVVGGTNRRNTQANPRQLIPRNQYTRPEDFRTGTSAAT